jgi:hypothetical protein
MKNFIALLFVGLFSVSVFAQSEGGTYNRGGFGTPASLQPWSQDQALASITQPYTSKIADSVSCTVSSKYGANYRLCQIRNLSASVQRYNVSILGSNDTTQIVLDSYGSTGRTFFIKRVISGAVVDSTAYDFLWKN